MGRASRPAPDRLPAKLKRVREALGLSQSEMLVRLGFGTEAGLFRSSISGYELGTRLPPYNVLLAYARAANVYVEALIDEELDLPESLPSARKSEGVRRLNP